MKLLYVIHQFFPECYSGTEQYCLAAAREARRRGDEVVILSLVPDFGRDHPPLFVYDQPYDDFRVLRLRHWFRLQPNDQLRDYENPLVAARFGEVLDEVKPDAVHVFHLRFLGSDCLGTARDRGIRTVVHLMDYWYLCPRFTLLRSDGEVCDGPPEGGLGCIPCHYPELRGAWQDDDVRERALDLARDYRSSPDGVDQASRIAAVVRRVPVQMQRLALADVVIAPSRFLAAMFERNGFPADRIRVVPYGLEPDRVRRIEVERPRNPLRIAFAGIFSPWKSPHLVVDAVRKIDAPLRLALHGPDEEPAFADYIGAMKRSAEGDDRIVFPGPYDHQQLSQVLADTDLIVVPSTWYENTPFVILEAFEAGVPVVASDLGGMAELIVEGANGFTFANGDSDSLAEVLRRCLRPTRAVGWTAPRTARHHRRQLPGLPLAVRRVFLIHVRHLRNPRQAPRNGPKAGPRRSAPGRAGRRRTGASARRRPGAAGPPRGRPVGPRPQGAARPESGRRRVKPTQAAAGLLCWPAIHAWGLGIAACTLLLDAAVTPFVALTRTRPKPADAEVASRNASIIVLNYDGRHYLERLLPSLERAVAETPGDHEILLVDNGSGDGSADFVEAEFPALRVLRLPENRYFIRGNRAGVEAAERDVLVFVNNDMEVEPEFLQHLLAGFDAEDVFAVTSRIEMDSNQVETGRTRALFRRGALHFVHSDGPREGLIPALWAGGGSSAFDRRKFEELGGFETLYDPCYVEDVSLSYRAWRRGWRVVFAPRSGTRHVHQGTSSVVFTPSAKLRIELRNRELFFWRSITDPWMVVARALWLPWNVMKRAGAIGYRDQLAALLAALPRLPAAWLARQRGRFTSQRTDAEVMRLANSVRRHRASLGLPCPRSPVALCLSSQERAPLVLDGFTVIEQVVEMPPAERATFEARVRGVPRRFWNAVGHGAITDELTDAVREIDHDVVLFRDPWALAATPQNLVDERAVLVDDVSATLDPAERGFVEKISRGVRVARSAEPERLRAQCVDAARG